MMSSTDIVTEPTSVDRLIGLGSAEDHVRLKLRGTASRHPAVFTELAGFESLREYANWAPVLSNVLWLSGLMIVTSAWTSDRRLLALTAWFFVLTNWVGQDYYSPQALAYFLHLVILGLCLRWFGVATPRWGRLADCWPTVGRAVGRPTIRTGRSASRARTSSGRVTRRVARWPQDCLVATRPRSVRLLASRG